jgi:hypothetical protein
MNRKAKHSLATLAAIVGASALSLATSSTALAENIGSTLQEGHALLPGQWMTSADGDYRFSMQGDGNLVFYQLSPGPIRALWASNTGPGYTPVGAFLQPNGNFALYVTQLGNPWSTGTTGWLGVTVTAGTKQMHIDGVLPYWGIGAAQTLAPPSNPPPPHATTLHPGERLLADQYLQSSSGEFEAYMQSDGNFVVKQNNHPIWATGTNGKPVVAAIIEDESAPQSFRPFAYGDFVLVDASGNVLWSAHANSHSLTTDHSDWNVLTSSLSMQDDGNLVLYASMEKSWPALPSPIN